LVTTLRSAPVAADDAPIFDDLPLAAFDGVQLRGGGGDLDALGDHSDFQGEIQLGALINFQDDAGADYGLEADVLDGNAIFAG